MDGRDLLSLFMEHASPMQVHEVLHDSPHLACTWCHTILSRYIDLELPVVHMI